MPPRKEEGWVRVLGLGSMSKSFMSEINCANCCSSSFLMANSAIALARFSRIATMHLPRPCLCHSLMPLHIVFKAAVRLSLPTEAELACFVLATTYAAPHMCTSSRTYPSLARFSRRRMTRTPWSRWNTFFCCNASACWSIVAVTCLEPLSPASSSATLASVASPPSTSCIASRVRIKISVSVLHSSSRCFSSPGVVPYHRFQFHV